MGDRLTKIVIVALLVVVGVYIAQPYFDRLLFSASTSRTVEPRGALADIERTSIELFERASPSVVQVVGARAGALDASHSPRAKTARPNRAPASSGTPPAMSSPTITSSKAPAASPCAWQRARCCGRSSSAPRRTTISR